MTSHTPPGDSRLPSLGFDLSSIFIGREQQLDLFHLYLDRWEKLMKTALSNADALVTAAPSPNNKIQGLVVLLYGRGGFGKSTLLNRYYAIAREPERHLIVSKIVDWEFAIEGKRSKFNPAPGQDVEASEYFRVLCGQLATVLVKRTDDFKEYQKAVTDVQEARKQARGVLESMQQDDRYAGLRKLTIDGLVTLVRAFDPTPATAWLDNEKIKQGIDEGVKIGADQLAHVYTKLRDNLGHKLSDYLEPALKLGLSLGRDLARFARDYPLVIFFDTYEEIDEADKLLRMVIGAAGVRVGWMIAGRDNLWAGSEQRKRSLDVEYGYKEIVLADRGLAIDFNTGGIGAFTLSDIVDYFSQLREMVRYEPPLPAVTEAEAAQILELTQGVPLAVKIAAGLYLETTDLRTITEKADGKRTVVEEMVRRYLLHTRADQDERARLCGLALLRRADEPAGIAAALELSPEQARTSYEAELSRLHRRYSFIFTEKAQPSLHQEVRHFLRLWLLEHRRDPEIVAVNERLKEAHETALKKLEDGRQYGNLKERFEDEEWVGTYLDLAEQQFWLDPAEGVRYGLPFMIAAAIYQRDANEEVVTMGNFFEANMKQPYSNWWKWAAQSLVYNSSRYPSQEELIGLQELTKLASQRRLTFQQLLPDCQAELEAALWWRLGEAYQDKDDNKALEWYEKALTRLDQQVGLREATAETCWNVAYKLYEEKKQAERMPFLNRAIELKPDYANAYNSRGNAYSALKQYEQAIADYNHAIELDPKYVYAYNGRGNAYRKLKQYERAIADYNHALELDPKYANAYNGRGNAFLWLKKTEQAKSDYNRARELEPKDVNLRWMAEWAAMSKKRVRQEIVEEFENIAAVDPQHYVAYLCRGVALGLRRKLKEGLAEMEKAIPLESGEWDAYFWKGMICAYMGRNMAAIEAIEKALEVDLPPILLTPLYWLERERPDFFREYAAPLLAKYNV
jgi:tetratricopeptide (TPR) repeat protein